MLLLLAGSAASGKTTVLPHLRSLPGLLTHDFDEGGVPADADTAWRQQRLEQWVHYAVRRQHEGSDVVLAGQSPLGELIACPSAAQLDSIAALLLDVDDRVRLAPPPPARRHALEPRGGRSLPRLGRVAPPARS